jgi:hypothetical protein
MVKGTGAADPAVPVVTVAAHVRPTPFDPKTLLPP